jgi:GTP cyclohydrolase II
VPDRKALGFRDDERDYAIAAHMLASLDANEHNRFYLETKAARSGHYIDGFGKPHLPEQGEPLVVGA